LKLFTADVSPEKQAIGKTNALIQPNHKAYAQLNKHAYFSQSYTDLHARPFPVSNVPLRVSQVCFLHQEGTAKPLSWHTYMRYAIDTASIPL